jgi:hypothetical protein
LKKSFPTSKPGSGGGAVQNAKGQSKQSQAFGKKTPAGKPGVSSNKPSGKASPLAKKKK